MNSLTRGAKTIITKRTHRVKTTKGQNGRTKFVIHPTLQFADKTDNVRIT
jgi:hypothetical protein